MITIEFVPYSEIKGISSEAKIKKLLKPVRENKIVLVQGRLKPSEEAALIQRTMEEISKSFKGIELCTISPGTKERDPFSKIKTNFLNLLLGDRDGITVIGPATIVKEIKRNPNKIELLTKDIRRRRG